ncbi:hypothetical protein [Amycolatopsis silviterrae]|uniref:DUF3558 domain-containing protein n=1 Tax=Amycolatopsis silviterrae TaxID=1656914 RepID=A0ABW5HHV8_9PSEU
MKTSHRVALWSGICIAVAATAVAVFWAAGLGSFLWGADHKTSDTTPDKYHDTDFAACTGFTARSPEIPRDASEVARTWYPEISKDGNLLCGFTPRAQQRPLVELQASWFATTAAQSGSEHASANFTGATAVNNDDSPVGLAFGEKAHWLPGKSQADCGLIFLDRNAVFQIHYTAATPGQNPESCRGPLRKMAHALYNAAQPR